MITREELDVWVDRASQAILERTFVAFVSPDRYPRQVGALIDRNEEGRWEVKQVARWDDAREAERRYGDIRSYRWDHLEWVR